MFQRITCVCVCMCFNDKRIRFIVFLLFHFHRFYTSYVIVVYTSSVERVERNSNRVVHTNEQNQVGKSGSFKWIKYNWMMYLLSWCFPEYLTLKKSRFEVIGFRPLQGWSECAGQWPSELNYSIKNVIKRTSLSPNREWNVEYITDVKYVYIITFTISFMLEQIRFYLFDQKQNRINKNIKYIVFILESFRSIIRLNILYNFEWENWIFQFHRICNKLNSFMIKRKLNWCCCWNRLYRFIFECQWKYYMELIKHNRKKGKIEKYEWFWDSYGWTLNTVWLRLHLRFIVYCVSLIPHLEFVFEKKYL